MRHRWIIALLILFAVPITAFAESYLGHIRLRMSYEGRAVSGGTVTLYDVSDCSEEVGPLEMLVCVKELDIPGLEKQVNGAGEVLFDGLEAGRYLLVQQKAAPGFYPIKPFLVRLSLVAGGTMIDRIDAAPKMEPEKKLPQTGQLVWPIWVTVGLGISLVAVGVVIRKRV